MSGGRFPASMRLKRRDDFRRVYRKGSIWKGTCVTIYVLRRETGPRLAAVVPRRWGTAVARNRMKRLVREAFRRRAAELPAVDLIVRAEPGGSAPRVEELEGMIVRAIEATIGPEVNG